MLKKLWMSIISLSVAVSMSIGTIPVGAATQGLPNEQSLDTSTDEIIVKFKEGFSWNTVKPQLNKNRNKIKKTKKLRDRQSILTVRSAEAVDETVQELNKTDGVEYAVPNDRLIAYDSGNERPMQWALQNSGQEIEGVDGVPNMDLHLADTKGLADGSGVVVAVLDSGVKIDLFEGHIYTNAGEKADRTDTDDNGYVDDLHGWDFVNQDSSLYDGADKDTHGTQVVSVLLSAAPGLTVLPLKVMESGVGYTSDAIEAIAYAKAMGVRIINCSWGSTSNNQALKEAMSDPDLLFICAGGNSTTQSSSAPIYPAAFTLPNTVSVGAIDNCGNITEFTNQGHTHDLYAPGKDIYTATPTGNAFASGTSFAAPFVAALAALMQQTAPAIDATLMGQLLKESYSQRDNIKIADAGRAVAHALPYAFLDHTDKRLSMLSNLFGSLLPLDVVIPLASHVNWNDLASSDKETMMRTFHLRAEELPICDGHDLIGTLLINTLADKVGISVSQVLNIYRIYDNYDTVYSELMQYSRLDRDLHLTGVEKTELLAQMETGHGMAALSRALMFSRAVEAQCGAVYGEDDEQSPLLESFADDERTCIEQITQTYHVSARAVLEAMSEHRLSPLELSICLFDWQQANNISVSDDEVTTLGSVSTTFYPSDFEKYKVQSDDNWRYGSVSIDQTDGMASFFRMLTSIPAQGGMNLDFGIRFDPEVADACVNANTPGGLAHTFTVNETRNIYTKSGGVWTKDAVETYSYMYTDADFNHAYWMAENGKEYSMTPDVRKYIRNITISFRTDSTPTIENSGNFYDNTYGLGVGIGLQFPVIEIDQDRKYLHLGDGRKYTIDQSGATYSLRGYMLSDYTLTASTDFHVGSFGSTYCLQGVSGTKEYFAEDGRYLGREDLYGNRLEVTYNESGKIAAITEPTGRSLRLFYTEDTSYRTVELWLYDKTGGSEPKRLYRIRAVKNHATNAYLLTDITDACGRSDDYSFEIQDNSIVINGRNGGNNGTVATVVNKRAVPVSFSTNGLYTNFKWEKAWKTYGYSSKREFARITSLSQGKNASEWNNRATFTYHIGAETSKTEYTTSYWAWKSDSLLLTEGTVAFNAMTRSDSKQEVRIDRYGYAAGAYVYQVPTYNTSILDSSTVVTNRDAYGLPTESVSKIGDTVISRSVVTHDRYGNPLNTASFANQDAVEAEKTVQIFDLDVSKTIPIRIVKWVGRDADGYDKKQMTVNVINAQNRITKTTVQAFLDRNGNNAVDANEDQTPLSETTITYDNRGNILTTVAKDLETGKQTAQNNVYDADYHTYVVETVTPNVLDADGNAQTIATSAEYNYEGQQTASFDENGHKTTYQYDAVGNLIRQTQYEKVGDEQIERYSDETQYDYTNHIVTEKVFAGVWTQTVYDVFGNPLQIYESENQGTTYRLKTTHTYNIWNQNIQSVEYATSDDYTVTKRTFDWAGRVMEEKAERHLKREAVPKPAGVSAVVWDFDTMSAGAKVRFDQLDDTPVVNANYIDQGGGDIGISIAGKPYSFAPWLYLDETHKEGYTLNTSDYISVYFKSESDRTVMFDLIAKDAQYRWKNLQSMFTYKLLTPDGTLTTASTTLKVWNSVYLPAGFEGWVLFPVSEFSDGGLSSLLRLGFAFRGDSTGGTYVIDDVSIVNDLTAFKHAMTTGAVKPFPADDSVKLVNFSGKTNPVVFDTSELKPTAPNYVELADGKSGLSFYSKSDRTWFGFDCPNGPVKLNPDDYIAFYYHGAVQMRVIASLNGQWRELERSIYQWRDYAFNGSLRGEYYTYGARPYTDEGWIFFKVSEFTGDDPVTLDRIILDFLIPNGTTMIGDIYIVKNISAFLEKLPREKIEQVSWTKATYTNNAVHAGDNAQYQKILIEQKDQNGTVVGRTASYGNVFGTVYSDTWSDCTATLPQFTDVTNYGPYGVVVQETGDTRVTKEARYDTAGRQNETIVGSEGTGKIEYTGFGSVKRQVTETNRARGVAAGDEFKYASVTEYDNLERPIRVKSPMEESGGVIAYAETKTYYDAAGNVVKTLTKTNAPGTADTYRETVSAYDFRGLLTQTKQSGHSGSLYTQYVYDANGNLVREYSGLSEPLTIRYSYDAAGAVTNLRVSGTDTAYSVTAYTYDIRGNKTSMTDPLGNTETYAYDELGRMTQKTCRSGKVVRWQYDAFGNVVKEEAGTVTNGTFTASITNRYGYDGKGRRLWMEDANGAWTWTYTDDDRVVTETMPSGFVAEHEYGDTTTATYESTGMKVTKDGETLQWDQYEYNDRKQLVRLNAGVTGPDYRSGTMNYTYDADGKVTERYFTTIMISVMPVSRQTFTYNLAGMVTDTLSQDGTVDHFNVLHPGKSHLQEQYSYFLDGNMRQKVSGSGTTGYTYDAYGRLAKETTAPAGGSTTETTYAFDDAGNRLSKTLKTAGGSVVGSIQYTYDKANRLLTETETGLHSETQAYTYDMDGNLIQIDRDGTFDRVYYYTALNQFRYTGGTTAVDATYTYDGLGRRFTKFTGGNFTRHIWDGDEIAYDYITDDDASQIYPGRDYIHGVFAEGVLYQEQLYFNTVNAHGDVLYTSLTATGNKDVVGSKQYDAYGNLQQTDGEFVNPYGYAGEYTDSETGFQYLRARYYNPRYGRFTQEDSWTDQGPNLYMYCGANPVMATDPSGHCHGYPNVYEKWMTADYTTYRSLKGRAGVTITSMVSTLGQPGIRLENTEYRFWIEADFCLDAAAHAAHPLPIKTTSGITASTNRLQKADEGLFKTLVKRLATRTKTLITSTRDTMSQYDLVFMDGITLSGGAIISGAFSINFVRDTKGNFALQMTTAEGGGTPNFSFTSTHGILFAPSLTQLRDMGIQTGGSLSINGADIGIDYINQFDKNNNKTYHGFSYSGGVGVNLPIDMHGEITQTFTLLSFNGYDILNDIYKNIMQW